MKRHLMTAAAAAGLFVTGFGASASASTYIVKPGDSLWKISRVKNVSVNQIKAWNQLKGDTIYVNQKLSLGAQAVQKTSAGAAGTTYTVQPGDCLSKIAKKFGTSVSKLKSMNGLTFDLIRIGQKLKVSGGSSVVTLSVKTSASTQTYRVVRGDTISEIAVRFHTTVLQIKALNHLSSDKIYAGQVLKIKGTAAPAQSKASAGQVVKTSLSAAAAKAAHIISTAESYIGVRYSWGGNTPASGFDCSGFVKYVFNKYGVSLPRTSADQWNATKHVNSPKAGDLVFFETYKVGPSHVGIYLGNNKFISATSTGVKISDMTSSYWKTRYLGATTAL